MDKIIRLSKSVIGSEEIKAVEKVGRFEKLSQLNPVLFDANFRKITIKFKPEDLKL